MKHPKMKFSATFVLLTSLCQTTLAAVSIPLSAVNVTKFELKQAQNIAESMNKMTQNADFNFAVKGAPSAPWLQGYQQNLMNISENKSTLCQLMSNFDYKKNLNDYIRYQFCLNQMLSSYTKKIVENGKDSFPIDVQAALVENLDFFIAAGKFQNIINLYQVNNSSELLTQNIESYINKNKNNDAFKVKIKFLNEQLKSLASAKEIEVNQVELKSSIKNIYLEFKKPDPDNIAIVKRTLDTLSFLENNKNKLDLTIAIKELNGLGRSLISNNFDSLSRKVYVSILSILDESNEQFYEITFNYFWTFFKTHDYSGAYDEIKKMGFLEKFDSLPSNIQYWVVMAIEKNTKNKYPLPLYKKIIETHPLSIYSILASKKILDFSEQLKLPIDSLNQDIISNKNLLINEEVNMDIYVSKKVETQLKRILLWNGLNLKKYMEIEIKDFLAINHEDEIQFRQLQPRSKANSKSKTKEKKEASKSPALKFEVMNIITLAKILQQNNQFIRSFTLLQDMIEREKSLVNSYVLKLLFPVNKSLATHQLGQKLLLDPAILLSLMRQESGFNPMARSTAGAMGLMQLMPGSARQIKKNLRGNELYNPLTNISIGQRFLKRLIDRYDGNLIYSFAAYNAGEGNLERWLKRSIITDGLIHTIESIPFSETRLYVKLLLRNLYFYKILSGKDVDHKKLEQFFDIDITRYASIHHL